jgi:hypothetical protein
VAPNADYREQKKALFLNKVQDAMFGKFNLKASAIVQKNKDVIYGRAIHEKSEPKTVQQWYNSASPIWNESKEVQLNYMKRMQMSFSPSELQ